MAAIYLIRHGQASFGKADYDQLSDKGAAQSRLLGKQWQSMPAPGKVYSGDLLRHGQTLEQFFVGYQGSEPSVILHSGFNEFDHVDLLTCYDARWKNFAPIAATIGRQPDSNKTFQKEFARAIDRWASGGHDSDYKESWSRFQNRCISALLDVVNQELTTKKAENVARQSKDICIFTSGGTISVIVQHILGLSDSNTLAVIQQSRNTSVTKLLFSKDSLSLDYLNNYSHLSAVGDDWVTFR